MECRACHEEKLRHEFPTPTDLPDCEHPLLVCVRCLHSSKGCRVPGCAREFEEPELAMLRMALSACDIEFDKEQLALPTTPRAHAADAPAPEVAQLFTALTLVAMDGRESAIATTPDMYVADLKMLVQRQLGVPANLQRLIIDDVIMQNLDNSVPRRQALTVGHYVRSATRRVSLVRLLFAVRSDSDLDELTFDLNWGYPPTRGGRRDYLDGAAFIFDTNHAYKDFVCHAKTMAFDGKNAIDGIQHSGDLMDDARKIGHHFINMKLSSVPPHITTIYLTLSAWDSPTIGVFPNVKITLHDRRRPTEELSPPWPAAVAAPSKALIMCALERLGGDWEVVNVGEPSAGCEHDLFGPIIEMLERRRRVGARRV